MNLTHILAFTALSLLVWFLTRYLPTRRPAPIPSLQSPVRLASTLRTHASRARLLSWLTLILSIVALYWLQSATPIRQLDFWLPTASLGLAILVWAATNVPCLPDLKRAFVRSTLITAAVIAAVVAAIALTRYVDPLCCLTPSRPPDIISVVIGLAAIAALAAGAAWAFPRSARLLAIPMLFILGLFVVLKLDPLTQGASAGLRALTGQDVAQASALDLRWLGFSYIAFRLLHVLRDRATGKLAPQAYSLKEFVTYVVFFPALTAGPIDRVERFSRDYRAATGEAAPLPVPARPTGRPAAKPASPPSPADDATEGLRRLLLGVFKKFVLADTLAVIALNSANAAQSTPALWTWLLVYAYALRIFLDFSGYTDIAIGLGRFFGIKLPENFDRPYLKSNLTTFWNSWHITLAQWFRAYFFNPVTRALRSPKETRFLPAAGFFRSPTFIVLFGQVGTMLLIGLWHGITWNFVAWGAWHAAGLFAHNRWTEFTRRRNAARESAGAGASAQPPAPAPNRPATILGVVLTFNFVALGWIWFALPSIDLSLAVFARLVGLR